MEKTLDSIQLTHRILMALTLALALLGFSAEKPHNRYQEVSGELSSLQEAVGEAAEYREKRNKEIFDKSALSETIIHWITSRKIATSFRYVIVEPDDVVVPNSEINPRVTVADQVLWADKIFDRIESPFYICLADRTDVYTALDKAFESKEIVEISSLTLDMKTTLDNFAKNLPFCIISISHEVSAGALSGSEEIIVRFQARILSISTVEGTDNSEGLHFIIKGHSLGDYEDVHEVVVPAIRAMWSEIGGKTPPNALAYVKQLDDDLREKRKTRIELLGQSVDSVLSLAAGSLMILALLIFMDLTISHLERISKGNEQTIKEHPFFGIMSSRWGQTFVTLTIVIFPAVITFLCLIYVVSWDRLSSIWVEWAPMTALACVLTAAIAAMGITVELSIRRVLLIVSERERRKTFIERD
jgi:hypothetical protein